MKNSENQIYDFNNSETISYLDIEVYANLLNSNKKFLYLVDIIVSDLLNYTIKDSRFNLKYIFFNPFEKTYFSLNLLINESNIIPSIEEIFPSANLLEQEITELYGITFKNRYLSKKGIYSQNINQENYYYRKDCDQTFIRENNNKVIESNKFYQKFNLSELLNQNIEVEVLTNEINEITKCEFLFGKNFKMLEKKFESFDPFQINYFFNEFNSYLIPFYSLSYSILIENKLELNISDRIKCIRMVILELFRVDHHVKLLFKLNQDIEANFNGNEFIKIIQKIEELNHQIHSFQKCENIICPGGLIVPINNNWIGLTLENLASIRIDLIEIHKNLHQSFGWRKKFGSKEISKKEAIEFNLTGPSLRASGILLDLRKTNPLYFYNDIEFEIPIGKSGTSYDRYLVYFEEIFQSIHIIDQLLNNLPAGSENDKNRFFELNMEETRFDSKLFIQKKFNELNLLEFPSGISGIYLLKQENKKKFNRVKCINNNFNKVMAYKDLIKSVNISDSILFFNSLGINCKEMEK